MMAKAHTKTILAFGDVHVPHQHAGAVEVLCRAAERLRPDLIVCLGDLLDCGQFSVHPPTFGMPQTEYVDDLAAANALLDRLQAVCDRLVIIEGNHEYRLDRWAAGTAEGRGAYSMLAPRIRLTQGRPRCIYVRYGSADGRYPHYRLNGRVIAVHGWSYARNATKQHLSISQGKSVIHGHTHRADASIVQNVWSPGKVVQARSAGCLCKTIPLYGTGRPVEWANAFILGYLGRRSDTLYTIPVLDGRCILPDGAEVRA
jgi:predicted phosphodiesterase